jgi:hypothetical protein
MTSLTPQNAFPGIPFPLHVAIPTSDIFTGAVQPQGNSTVLTFKNAFPGVAFSVGADPVLLTITP